MSVKTKPGWIWKFYFFLYLCIIATGTVYFFSPLSPINIYYQTLIALETSFLWQYLCNALSIILGNLSLCPLYLYVFQLKGMRRSFWQWVFILRLGFDLTGRFFEMNFLKSFFYSEPKVGLMVLSAFILFHLPAYIAHAIYAFDKNECDTLASVDSDRQSA